MTSHRFTAENIPIEPLARDEARVCAAIGREVPSLLSTQRVQTICSYLSVQYAGSLPDDVTDLVARGRTTPHALTLRQVQAVCALLHKLGVDNGPDNDPHDTPAVDVVPGPDVRDRSAASQSAAASSSQSMDDRTRLAQAIRAASGNDASTITETGVDRLIPCPLRPPRAIDEAKLAELAASIATRGILQPILVRPTEGGHEIVVGERRWRAARLAGRSHVPAIILTLSDREVIELLLVENLQRQDIAPLEEAEAYRRLVEDHGMSHHDVASAVGKSRSHVANTMRLLGLPGAAKALLASGRVTAGHARAALASPDPVEMLRGIAEEGKSVRETEETAREGRDAQRRPRHTASEHPRRAELEARLTNATGLPLRLRLRGDGAGQLSSRVDIDRLDALLAQLETRYIQEAAR